ncbi:hypothetical protein LUZ62_088765 [Rhynchospora pubera]|uniref:VanZ-like domain-containing protein n=1 Tax=Rhynchospora pubera TaxID=906938 RepID=A0AAV8CG41_9POAL|nr:hypothetical protein LUZ62_088765 [Rhynchospora pubera]
MEWEDEWWALDKAQHLLACLLITLLVAALAGRSRHAFLRRRSAAIGSVASLFAGAAKEAGDEIGLWRSAGGSAKDAVADLLGVVLALIVIDLWRRWVRSTRRRRGEDEGLSMV